MTKINLLVAWFLHLIAREIAEWNNKKSRLLKRLLQNIYQNTELLYQAFYQYICMLPCCYKVIFPCLFLYNIFVI